MESFATRFGLVLLVLGAMHFFNAYVFNRMRRRGRLRHAPPPVTPDQVLVSKLGRR
jgi:hypothetical protein